MFIESLFMLMLIGRAVSITEHTERSLPLADTPFQSDYKLSWQMAQVLSELQILQRLDDSDLQEEFYFVLVKIESLVKTNIKWLCPPFLPTVSFS